VPEGLVQLVSRSTAKKKEDRPQNFTQVCAALESLIREVDPRTTAEREAATTPDAGRKSKFLVFGILAFIAIAVSGLIYIKTRKTETVLLPVLTTDTGEMALVPGGPFLQGIDKKQVTVPPFYIDRTEVTNEAYQKFCAATNRPLPEGFPQDRPKYPVVDVTAADAIAFAKWAGKRLPQAVEWEKAARGTEGKTWPWGDANDPKRANVADNPTLPAHQLMEGETMPEGASPYNALHMAGNVLEYAADNITPSTDAVQHFSQIMKPPPALNEPWYSVKGGSFGQPLQSAVPWEWSSVPARFHAPDIGFRCAKDPPK
jgi:eukaryotic-like serine/threonine-protein kinase